MGIQYKRNTGLGAMILDIEFEWFRGSQAFRLLDDKPAVPRAHGASPTFTPGVSGISIPQGLMANILAGSNQRIVAAGALNEKYRPLVEYETLFRVFVKDAQNATGVLNFMNKFGPLTKDGLDKDIGERVPFVILHARAMQKLLSAYISGDKAVLSRTISTGVGIGTTELARVMVRLVVDRGSQQPRLQFSVQDLLTALWLQLSQTIAGGKKIRACSECTNLFEVGPGTGRRLDAKFCSDEHRIAFNSRKRTEET